VPKSFAVGKESRVSRQLHTRSIDIAIRLGLVRQIHHNCVGYTFVDFTNKSKGSAESMAQSASTCSSSRDASENPSSAESGQDESTTPVETLISGREKRTNAGNRLSRLIQEEEEKEDELTLLFEEDEQDVEFDAIEENQSDEQLDSTSDEDDGGHKGDEELDGERELAQQAKAERQKEKRKAESMWTGQGTRKKVKIDPAVIQDSNTVATQPKKKADRSSWMPNPDESSLRSSSRRATVQNKQAVHERMKEHEARRLKQVASMEAAANKKQKSRARVLTQEDRLLEAARTEKINGKSLSRWEKDETKREAERRAKLAALHRRQMEGPVITSYSGPAVWINGALAYVGRKPRTADLDDDVPAEDTAPAQTTLETPVTVDAELVQEAPSQVPVNHRNSAIQLGEAEQQPSLTQASGLQESSPHKELPGAVESVRSRPSIDIQEIPPYDPRWQIAAPPPPLIEPSTRNLVILQNFDPVTTRDRDSIRQILVKTKRGGGRSHSKWMIVLVADSYSPLAEPIQHHCAITSQPAKYRDPTTEIPYATRYAYQEIQRLKLGSYQWSDLLGCFVGTATTAAQGVPEDFWTGRAIKPERGTGTTRRGSRGRRGRPPRRG
jgi:vacuolar protein sorting-associated protein 72